MADLHQRLLAATSALTVAEERTPEELAAALRAVVERHSPTTVGSPQIPACSACSSRAPYGGWIAWVAHPCGELQLIADQLGLTDQGERS